MRCEGAGSAVRLCGAMGAPAVTVLSLLTEGIVDAALEHDDAGEVRAFDVALERYRSAGAPGALALARIRGATGRDRGTIDVLRRLDRDLLAGLAR